MRNKLKYAVIIMTFFFFSSCTPPSTAVSVREVNPSHSIEGVSGLGIESKDIILMSKKMVYDILADPNFSKKTRPPTIIIDDKRFLNESSQIININLLLDRLRIELMRESRGRLEFLSRKNMDLVMEEHQIDGVPIKSADYRMIGRISSIRTASNKTGIQSNFLQFSFEILDLSEGYLVWGNIYDVKKYGADDTVYR